MSNSRPKKTVIQNPANYAPFHVQAGAVIVYYDPYYVIEIFENKNTLTKLEEKALSAAKEFVKDPDNVKKWKEWNVQYEKYEQEKEAIEKWDANRKNDFKEKRAVDWEIKQAAKSEYSKIILEIENEVKAKINVELGSQPVMTMNENPYRAEAPFQSQGKSFFPSLDPYSLIKVKPEDEFSKIEKKYLELLEGVQRNDMLQEKDKELIQKQYISAYEFLRLPENREKWSAWNKKYRQYSEEESQLNKWKQNYKVQLEKGIEAGLNAKRKENPTLMRSLEEKLGIVVKPDVPETAKVQNQVHEPRKRLPEKSPAKEANEPSPRPSPGFKRTM